MVRLMVGLVVFALAGQAWGQSTKVYKWVDEDGVTHYTTTPPDDQQFQQIKVSPNEPPSAVEAVAAVDGEATATPEEGAEEEPEETFLERRQREQAEREAQRREREMLAAECSRAQRALTFYTTHTRINEPTADGADVRRITEEERQSHIRTAQDRVARYCNQ